MSAARWSVALIALAACDPLWTVQVGLRDPSRQPVAEATVAVACPYRGEGATQQQMSAQTDATGTTHITGMGYMFPIDCDVIIARPGYRTVQIRYGELCPFAPREPQRCERAFVLERVLEPE